jgi:hypothetical protein
LSGLAAQAYLGSDAIFGQAAKPGLRSAPRARNRAAARVRFPPIADIVRLGCAL